MTPRLPPLLDERDLPVPQLRAAVLDGDLYPLGERFRPVDLPQDPVARAGALRHVAAHARVLSGRTAAWIWGATPILALPYSVIVPSTAAVGHPTGLEDRLVQARSAQLRLGDIARLDGVPVTSPLHTAIGLICEAADDWDPPTILRLADCTDGGLIRLESELRSRPRVVGRRRGLSRLQVLVTRYTS